MDQDFLFTDAIEVAEFQGGVSNIEKLTESYLSLKQRICSTHDVIKKYNDKLKECERLKSELDEVTKQSRKVTCNFNSTLAKVIKLELQNTEYKKNIENLSSKLSEHEIKVAADQQYIQQLVCKVKNIEQEQSGKTMEYDLEKSVLQVKIKELEQELKSSKKAYDTKIKKIEKKSGIGTGNSKLHKLTDEVKETLDVAVNTIRVKEVTKSDVATNTMANNHNVIMLDAATNTIPVANVKKTNAGVNTMPAPKVVEISVMTNESFSMKDDVYPLHCAKCEILLEPPPLEKICRMMRGNCPKLLEKIPSPQKMSSPLILSTDATKEHRKVDNATRLSEIPITPNQQSQKNHNDFAAVNHSLWHPPNCMDGSICDNTLTEMSSQTSNLINQSNRYNGTMMVKSLPLLTSSVLNHNNSHMLDIPTVAPSMSIIESLQKRVDTLEVRLKKQCRKRKMIDDTNFYRYQQPHACHAHDVTAPFQTTNLTLELLTKMTDLFDRKEKSDSDSHKLSLNKSSEKSEYKRVKVKKEKRLQKSSPNNWKVEPLPKRYDDAKSPRRKRSKMRKFRHYLFDGPDVSLKAKRNGDTVNSNSESCSTAFDNDSVHDKTDEQHSPEKKEHSESESHEEVLYETSAINEIHSSKYSKSMVTETDSGILSDSVESNKLVQMETDTDACSDSTESKNTTDHEDLVELNSAESDQFKSNTMTETEIKLNTSERPMEVNKSTKSKQLTKDAIHSLFDNPVADSENASVNKLEKPTTHGRPKVLVNKLKNLEKDGILPSTLNTTLNKRKVYPFRHENSNVSNKITHINNLDEDEVNVEDFIPKKKARIAHIPKDEKLTEGNKLTNHIKIQSDVLTSIVNTKINGRRRLPAIIVAPHNYSLTKSYSNTQTIADRDDPQDVNSVKSNQTYTNNGKFPDCISMKHVNNSEQIEKMEISLPNTKNSVSKVTEVVGDDNVHVASTFASKLLKKSRQNENFDDQKSQVNIGDKEADINEEKALNMSDTCSESSININDEMQTTIDLSDDEEITELSKGDGDILEHHSDLLLNTSNDIVNAVPQVVEEEDVVSKIGGNLFLGATCIPNVAQNESNIMIDKSANTIEDNSENILYGSNSILSPDADSFGEVNRESSHIREDESIDSNSKVEQINFKQKERMSVYPDFSNEIQNTEKTFLTTIKEQEQMHRNTINTYNTIESNEEISSMASPLTRLREYVNKKNPAKSTKKQAELQSKIDKWIQSQLDRLTSGTWETSVHMDVVEKLNSTCSARIIAKAVVEYMCLTDKCVEKLDKTYTPPAPLMTKSQQRIVALLVDLQKTKPTLYHLVQAGIEYTLFKLTTNKTHLQCVLEALVRIYVVLARIQKDRERVRIFCCDALYCLGITAMTVFYIVFTCWPEVFPNANSTSEPLPKCIAHIIKSQEAATEFPKFNALKNLVSLFYQYRNNTVTAEVLNDLITALAEKPDGGLDTAIILLAKKNGTLWTYKNIVLNALLPMIINNKHASVYRAFRLLGCVMRAFPVKDEDKSVGKILEQLCDLINSGEGSADQQEGIVSALLCLSRHNFYQVTKAVLNWTPSKPLYPTTVRQLNAFMKSRDADFWKGYFKKNKFSEREV